MDLHRWTWFSLAALYLWEFSELILWAVHETWYRLPLVDWQTIFFIGGMVIQPPYEA